MLKRAEIQNYVAPYLLEFEEHQWIYQVLNKEFSNVWENVERVLLNFFIETMEEFAVAKMEKMLEIIPNKATQSLAFRRERIKNRLLLSPPFTIRFLRSQLDNIIGVGAYQLRVDNENYIIYLESSALNQDWYNEIVFTIRKMKPCNMIFTNKPFLTDCIAIQHSQEIYKLNYQYILGDWRLGEQAFTLRERKSENNMAVEQNLLQGVTNYINGQVAKVQLNDNVFIEEFEVREVMENTVVIEYPIKKGTILEGTITNVKLLNESGDVLSNTNVYVPVLDDILAKHTIRVKESE